MIGCEDPDGVGLSQVETSVDIDDAREKSGAIERVHELGKTKDG